MSSALANDHFKGSIEAKTKAMSVLSQPATEAGNLLITALRAGHKILCVGNGGSAGDAQHFAAELTNRYRIEREPLAAIALTTDTSALTAIGNDYDFNLVFSKQVEALGRPGDILLAISTSGNSKNVVESIRAAHDKGMIVLALTGKSGGEIADKLKADDLELRVPSDITAHIQEVHITLIHILCELIDVAWQEAK